MHILYSLTAAVTQVPFSIFFETTLIRKINVNCGRKPYLSALKLTLTDFGQVDYRRGKWNDPLSEPKQIYTDRHQNVRFNQSEASSFVRPRFFYREPIRACRTAIAASQPAAADAAQRRDLRATIAESCVLRSLRLRGRSYNFWSCRTWELLGCGSEKEEARTGTEGLGKQW